jgi:pilus assembly protein CpaC
MSRITACCVALTLTVLQANVVAAQQALELTLDVGEQRVLSSEGVASYSEGVPGIVDVRLTKDGSSFVVVGRQAGRTSLLFMTNDRRQLLYRIVVTDPNAAVSRPSASDDVEPEAKVRARDNVRLDFYFVQLDRDQSMQAGVSWPAFFGGGSLSASFDLLARSFTGATALITEQALPRLDLAQVRGHAKLLRQATVITASGSQAQFGGGGEINIPVQNTLSVGVRQISFGSDIKVGPRYDRDSGRLELAIHAEVSDLTSDHGSGIPGRTTSTLESLVNLELGQSLIIAGLTARSESSAREGLPWLSQIPILGALFGVQRSRSTHTENLIFIVPTVVEAVSLHARERVREALDLFQAYDGNLDEVPLRSIEPGSDTPARSAQRGDR